MKYFKLLERAYLNGAIREQGEVVAMPDETGPVGQCMIPCDEEGNELKRKATKPKAGEDIG